MANKLGDFATVQEIATMLGISEQAVRRALKEKRIRGQKMGKIWLVPKTQFKQPNDSVENPDGGK